ncbi:MAG: epoxyqueuosine reductase [bacterium]|nr:epoxyqueuosine reductase [bacterium]
MTKKAEEIYTGLESRLGEVGMRVRAVDTRHLPELREDIESRFRKMIDTRLYWKYLSKLSYALPEEMPGARSIVVVAAPSPILQVTFRWKEREYETLIPPTYNHDSDDEAIECIEGHLKPGGYRIIKAGLPEKLLAVRSGLAKYGKNNITYVEGMGSYHRPVVFFTDAPLPEEYWGEPLMAEQCGNCKACVTNCPTGAISKKRFLLHAEKCLTYFNESERKIPAWIEPGWHNSLVGCMRCQEVCPINRPYKNRVKHVGVFTHEETEQLLEGSKAGLEGSAVMKKLIGIGLVEDYEYVPRNLKLLIEQKKGLPQEKR